MDENIYQYNELINIVISMMNITRMSMIIHKYQEYINK